MNRDKLFQILVEVSGVDDFELDLTETYSSSYWGRYFPKKSLVRLYGRNEDGSKVADDILIREGLHEVTHHIQYHHLPFWERRKGVMHDSLFWYTFNKMKEQYFGVTAI